MKKAIISIIAICLFISAAQAQEEKIAKNAVFIELGGVGGYYSINYDRIFFNTEKLSFSGSVGFSPFTPIQINDKTHWDFYPRIPLSLNAITGKNNHHFKFGLAYTPYYYDENEHLDRYAIIRHPVSYPPIKWQHPISLAIGYRYQKPEKGVFLNVDFTPFHYNQGFEFYPWGGIGIGYSF